jgi:cob(I)alamin adenosyltransferase
MKIYTKQGDKGYTSLIGGKRVPKTHIRIEAYGSVDELIAHIAMLKDLVRDEPVREFLLFIQERLMTCTAILAADCEDCGIKIPMITDADIYQLELKIDEMESTLPHLNSFILPGGNTASSQSHIARTVCRRAERQIISLSTELFVPDVVIKFINRLSDYLFVLSRKILQNNNQKDIPWIPSL